MKKVLFAAFLVNLVAASPARAQGTPLSERPWHLNIGGGFPVPVSDVSARFGTGGGFNVGVIFDNASPLGLQVEYSFNSLDGDERSIPLLTTPFSVVAGETILDSHHDM